MIRERLSKSIESRTAGRFIGSADRMLELCKKNSSLPPSAEREKIEREITVTDGERKITEGNGR